MKTSKFLLLSGAAILLSMHGAAWAQDASNADADVEKTSAKSTPKKANDQIIITGTRIAQDNYNTSSPVIVIDAVEFERTGATSVFELLSLLPEIGVEGIIDSAPYVSGTGTGDARGGERAAVGADSISLRSLGANATLILVNGRRIAPHSLVQGDSQNAQAITNLDNIPVEAIERIEVLKGGASTIYGSDAMAGVINIILKKGYNDMRSLTANIKMATKGDNAQYRLAYSQGFSNIGGGDNSITFSGEYVRQNSLLANKRLPGRETLTSAGGTLSSVSFPPPDFNRTTTYRPYNGASNCTAAGGTVNADNQCVDDIGGIVDLTPSSDRFALTMTYDQSLANGVDIFANATWSYRNQNNNLAPQEFPGAGEIRSISRGIPGFVFVPGTPGEQFNGQISEVGNRSRDAKSRSLSLVGGFKGKWNEKINWEISGRYSRNSNTVTYKNYVLTDKFFAALNQANTTDPRYIFGQPGVTDAAVIDSFRAPMFQRRGISTSSGIDAHISGDLFDGPAGPISYAFGGTFTSDTYKDRPDAILDKASRNVLGGLGGNPYDASRSRSAVFGELLVPVIQNHLDIELSAREDFDDVFGSHFSPKIGFRLDAVPDKLLIRGSYTTGFRAPSIVEFGRPTNTNPNAFFSIPTGSSYTCKPGDDFFGFFCLNVNDVTTNNPNIIPETSKQYNLGAVLRPTDNLELAVDWYKINRTNEITFFSGQGSADTHPETIVLDANGDVDTVFSFFGNLGNTENQGVDFTARYRVDLGKYGELSNNLSVVHNLSVIDQRLIGGGRLDIRHRTGFTNQPKWRATNTLSWLAGDWRTTVTYRYRGTFNNAAFSLERFQTSNPCNASSNTNPLKYNCMVPAHDTVDFNVGFTGITNVTLTFNVRNLFDEIEERDIRVNNPQNFRRIGREASFRANYRF